MSTIYDCIIVGGGIAGLQAAIQLGRYSSHHVLVIDAGYGRSTLCQSYHNILGYPDGISGLELRTIGREQAVSYGIEFLDDRVIHANKSETGFELQVKQGDVYFSRTLLLATGVMDRFPAIPGLVETLGISVYVCPDCDGYEVEQRTTIVMGAGNTGAQMALTLSERTQDLIYVNHDSLRVDESLHMKLRHHGIHYFEGNIQEVRHASPRYIAAVVMSDGQTIEAERGFIAFGGNQVHSNLAKQLGAELLEHGHVACDPRSKESNVPGLWVAGDLGVHAEQVTVAMGDGATAAIWIHKALRP